MSPKDLLRYQAIAEALLKRHYGVQLADTPLRDLSVVAWHIEALLSPYEAVNQCVEACGWFKQSLLWSPPGSTPSNLVTLEEEAQVVLALPEEPEKRVLH